MLKKLMGVALATAMGLAVVMVAAIVETPPRHGATTTTVASR